MFLHVRNRIARYSIILLDQELPVDGGERTGSNVHRERMKCNVRRDVGKYLRNARTRILQA